MTRPDRTAAINACARAAHEANRAYCFAIGDFSLTAWEDSPRDMQLSVIDGAAKALADPTLTPERSHENWLAFKTREGWVYGVTKSYERKTHPCMISYADLPDHHRAKDVIFLTVVRVVATALGL